MNILKLFQQWNTNAYIILISLSLVLWFYGWYSLIEYILPKTIYSFIGCILISLSILYFNDGSLSELYDVVFKPNLQVAMLRPQPY